jgi:hypothetical protein
VLRDPDLRAGLADAGPARAASFSWSAAATATLRVYREAAGSAAGAGV